MQLGKLAFLAAVVSSVTAQTSSSTALTLSNLPQCALTPALSAIQTTGCGVDIACVCKDSAFLTNLTPVIQKACSASDFQQAVAVAVQLCASYGVSLSVPNFASSTSAPVSVTTSTPASTAAVTTTTSTTPVSSVASTTVSKNATVTSVRPTLATANVAAAHGSWAAAGLLGVGALLAAL